MVPQPDRLPPTWHFSLTFQPPETVWGRVEKQNKFSELRANTPPHDAEKRR
jgi:hypothetical protein